MKLFSRLLVNKRLGMIGITVFILVVTLALTLAPQVTVWACSATGSCPCPGC